MQWGCTYSCLITSNNFTKVCEKISPFPSGGKKACHFFKELTYMEQITICTSNGITNTEYQNFDLHISLY